MNYLKNSKLNLKFNEPLKDYTTFSIGGLADVLVKPEGFEELKSLIKTLIKEKAKFFILGCGSNLLIRDEGFKGVVITLKQGEFLHIKGPPQSLEVGAGVSISMLLGWCRKRGITGLEFMAGIPASIGGAIKQNAGINKRTIADVIKDVSYLDENAEVRTLSREDLNFSYRSLDLKLLAIIKATLKLKESNQEKVKKNIRFFFDLKRQTQPIEEKSAGCIFKNPYPKSAGILIEEVGLKGKHCGGAYISEKHGNFIINKGGATFSDVLKLIDLVKEKVKFKKNVLLETEVSILE
jgi:UDP-N-acetylmuramate dehydrogenase